MLVEPYPHQLITDMMDNFLENKHFTPLKTFNKKSVFKDEEIDARTLQVGLYLAQFIAYFSKTYKDSLKPAYLQLERLLVLRRWTQLTSFSQSIENSPFSLLSDDQ